jgi:EAL domain-containing protein (putative c-di-GMP-specific phosphodiesterase class I)
MAMLSEYGIHFSIDDFGTGHSSLNRLDQLPLSVLKVDRSFTERLLVADGTRSIVEAIISMAKALKMFVVAEGVETEEQVLELSKMGCDYLQGFLLSQPLEPEAIPSLIQYPHPLLVSLNLSNRIHTYSAVIL